ncbi:MAG: hypothetical protein F4186_08625 [Boseongicola sp. SB0676_bin_33]|uniref:Fatty acid desaturase domain-containing protein n=1 Tax=Boseongicola sp. SB0664_bin_43 TaxID=2604844 RepID=A0A6B0XV38_9RHOB|nr:hypothetical protein [Boseongicola sp. SB0664_bin_43]MYF89397.1 hypothetical protein [Boseongicola sp. SB0676_bin_33]
MFSTLESTRNRFGNTAEDDSLVGQTMQAFRPRQMPPMSALETVSAADQSCLAPKALLHLYTHLHVVHHAHPTVPWCGLPKLFHTNKERFPDVNDRYLFRSRGKVFRRHFMVHEDPVANSPWRRRRIDGRSSGLVNRCHDGQSAGAWSLGFSFRCSRRRRRPCALRSRRSLSARRSAPRRRHGRGFSGHGPWQLRWHSRTAVQREPNFRSSRPRS